MLNFDEFKENEQLYNDYLDGLVKLKIRTSGLVKTIRVDILSRFTDIVSPGETLFGVVSPVSLRQNVARREARGTLSY